MAKRPQIPFFIDNCVPDSVGKELKKVGHKIALLRETMPNDTPDPVVAIACVEAGSVLVTHDGDFRTLAKRLGTTQRKYHSMHRIQLRCREPNSKTRIIDALSLIEYEWRRILSGQGNQMVIEISEASIKIMR